MTRFTKEQMDALAPYETNFLTATRSDWARHPGSAALAKMVEIYNTITGNHRKVNGSCQTCVLGFLKDLGGLYLQEKAQASQKRKKPSKKEK